ncbi:MAG: hypothetical protein QMD77_02095 [Patescibacteria group bacterium]|nr:hypothetical protein [Patescibacteria group bacterium]
MPNQKQNCWEVRKCGREPGGEKVEELGICPAPLEKRTDGINGGKNGGRACFAIAGTFCEGKIQGTLAKKLGDCLECDFFRQVVKEEGDQFEFTEGILSKIS